MKKRLLFLTPTIPCIENSGGIIKTRLIIEALSADFDIDLFCVESSGLEQDVLSKFKADFCLKELNISLGTRSRSIFNLLRSYLKSLPLSVYRNYHYSLEDKINSIAAMYDVIFVDHFIMAVYVNEQFYNKTIFHQHNAEFKMWRSFAAIQDSVLKKVFLKFESNRIEKYEKFYCQKFHKTFAAPNDIYQFTQLGVDINNFVKTYHLGSKLPLNYVKHSFNQTKNSILYVGTLSWQANIDGLIWFLKSIWPKFKIDNPCVVLNIAGKGAPDVLVDLVNMIPDVNLLGFVEDLDKLYHQSRAFIAPLRFGSGIKVKVVEAMSRGIPVVTTSTGIEGLDVTNGEQLFFTDDEILFSQYLSLLMNSNDICWTKMSETALRYSNEELSLEKVINDIKRIALSV